EIPDDLASGETLVDRRRAELERSAAVLGVHRVVWLGYKDSGMTGWPQNADPESFWQADVEQAAARLAAVLREEHADVLTAYDWHGVYGHPDHVKVHTVGHRAADLAGTAAVFDATMNRDHITRMRAEFAASTSIAESSSSTNDDDGAVTDFDPNGPADDGNPFGEPEAAITHRVDVSAYLTQKRESLRCHSSQITDSSLFLKMPEEAFVRGFGIEWFIKRGATPGVHDGWLFE
ncbi:MAG: PIG-L family deacetylase, partial [Ilumatobacteraceae bacterium]